MILAVAVACVWRNTMRIDRKYASGAETTDAEHP